jgi:hypothetical protein
MRAIFTVVGDTRSDKYLELLRYWQNISKTDDINRDLNIIGGHQHVEEGVLWGGGAVGTFWMTQSSCRPQYSSSFPSLYKVRGAAKQGKNSANQPASSVADARSIVIVDVNSLSLLLQSLSSFPSPSLSLSSPPSSFPSLSLSPSRMPSSRWQWRGWRGGGGGRARRSRPTPGLGNLRWDASLRSGAVDAIVILFKDGATGAGILNGVGACAGAGAGVVAIVDVFVDNAVRGADRAANAA